MKQVLGLVERPRIELGTFALRTLGSFQDQALLVISALSDGLKLLWRGLTVPRCRTEGFTWNAIGSPVAGDRLTLHRHWPKALSWRGAGGLLAGMAFQQTAHSDPADTVDPLDASQFNPNLASDIEPEPWIAAAQLGLAILLLLGVCWLVVFGIPWAWRKIRKRGE